MKSTAAILAFILAAFTLAGSLDYATEASLAAEYYGAAHSISADLVTDEPADNIAGRDDKEPAVIAKGINGTGAVGLKAPCTDVLVPPAIEPLISVEGGQLSNRVAPARL